MMNTLENNVTPYRLLPFRFERFNDREVFVVNEVGEFLFLDQQDFQNLLHYRLTPQNPVFLDLKGKHIVTDTEIDPVVEMLATKYRTKKSFLNSFTALHMVVPTLRCNSNCRYCQVSRKDVTAGGVDMDKPTAKKTIDLVFKSPSPAIKIEFQGGEPLLNLKMVKYIIEYAEWKNLFAKKRLEFVICTNLTLVNAAILRYLKKHHVYISTSLDGPKDLHNKNRPLQDTDNSYDAVIDKIALCRSFLGSDGVSALMTATRFSLGRFKDIVDEYRKQDFNVIFLRALNPYGFAKRESSSIGYSMEEFVSNYLEVLDDIIDINLQGTYFMEAFASLLLTRMLTPFSTGFVDMQSPAGVGISGVVYDYNGNVYVSDEARMLASTGDHKFLMGNVHKNTYEEIFSSEFMHSLISSSCLEALPQCSDCAFQSYCGADPVRNYSEQGDIVGHPSKSDICRRNKRIMRYLLELIKKNDKNIDNVLWSWIERRPISTDDKGEPCYA
jgi:His-Xaa-Ser system radical SAM maturase HxsB